MAIAPSPKNSFRCDVRASRTRSGTQARHSRHRKLPNSVRRVAELPEHLVRMLAEDGRMPRDRGGIVIEQHRVARGAHGPEPRMSDLLDDLAGDDLRMIEYLLEIVHQRAGNAGSNKRGLEVARRARADRGLDEREQRLLMRLAACIARKPRIADMRGEAQHL